MPSGVYERTPETKAKLSVAQRGNTNAKVSPLGATRMNNDGYRLVKVAEPDVWELEHRVNSGLTTGDGKIAHHGPGGKTDNSPANLRVFETNSEHIEYHHCERREAL